MVESAKISVQLQKKKLVVRLTDTPEPFMIKVKLDTKKGKPLVISTKSSNSVNTASLVNQLGQAVPWPDPMMIHNVKGQPPQDSNGIGYRMSTKSNMYSPAS